MKGSERVRSPEPKSDFSNQRLLGATRPSPKAHSSMRDGIKVCGGISTAANSKFAGMTAMVIINED